MSAKLSRPGVNDHNDNTGRKLDHEQFRVQLAIQLLEEHNHRSVNSIRLHSHGSLSVTSLRTCHRGSAASKHSLSVSVSSAANRRERGGRRQHISENSASWQCAWCPASSSTTPRKTHSTTSNTITLFGAHLIMFYLLRTTTGFSKSHQSTKTFTKGAKCLNVT